MISNTRLLDAMKSGNKDVVLYCLNDPEYQIDLFKAALKNLSETQPNDDIFHCLISALQNTKQPFRNEILCDKEVKDALIEYFRSILQSVDQSKIKKVISILECTELDASVTESILLSLCNSTDDLKVAFLKALPLKTLLEIIDKVPTSFQDFLCAIQDISLLNDLKYVKYLDLTFKDVIFIAFGDNSEIWNTIKDHSSLEHSQPLYGPFSDIDKRELQVTSYGAQYISLDYPYTKALQSLTDITPPVLKTNEREARLHQVLSGEVLSPAELVECCASNWDKLQSEEQKQEQVKLVQEAEEKYGIVECIYKLSLNMSFKDRGGIPDNLDDEKLKKLFLYSTNGLNQKLTEEIFSAYPDRRKFLLQSLIGTGTLHNIVGSAHSDLLMRLLEKAGEYEGLLPQLVNDRHKGKTPLMEVASAMLPKEARYQYDQRQLSDLDLHDGAVKRQYNIICDYLLYNGADITARDNGDYTALHMVTIFCNTDIAKTLIAKAKELELSEDQFLNAKSHLGETALDILQKNEMLPICAEEYARTYGQIFYIGEGNFERHRYDNRGYMRIIENRDKPEEIKGILKEAGCKKAKELGAVYGAIDTVKNPSTNFDSYRSYFASTALWGFSAILLYDLIARNGAMTSAIIGNIGKVCSKFFETAKDLGAEIRK